MKTKLIVVLIVLALFLVACGADGSPASPADAQPTYTALPTYTAYPTFTAVPTEVSPTESATALPSPTASPIPTFTSTPLPTLAPVSTCGKHGTVAWQNDNQTSGATYGLAPVGGLNEECGVVGQTHFYETDADGNQIHARAVFYVPANSVEWIKDYLGGTGWYFGGSEADVRANLAQQAKELEERDGQMKTYIIILPGDAENFPIHDHFQTK